MYETKMHKSAYVSKEATRAAPKVLPCTRNNNNQSDPFISFDKWHCGLLLCPSVFLIRYRFEG